MISENVQGPGLEALDLVCTSLLSLPSGLRVHIPFNHCDLFSRLFIFLENRKSATLVLDFLKMEWAQRKLIPGPRKVSFNRRGR